MSTNNRIHFFVRTLNEELGGGSHHNAISFIRLLRETGYEVIVHTFVLSDNRPPKDIQLIEHHGDNFGFLKAQNFLRKLLNQYEPDADLFFLYGVDFMWGGGQYRFHKGKIPVAIYLDTYLDTMKLKKGFGWLYHFKRTLWDRLIGWRYIKYVDRFLAVSPFLLEQYTHFGFPKNKFSVVPNFFILSDCQSHNVDINNPVRLLYTGRIIYDKGVDLLIKAVARLPKKYNWTLRIVGDGLMKNECINLTKTLNITSKIKFIPWINARALANEYKHADIFVHPARWPEPFGRTIVEAMEYGVPVIVPSKGAPAWIVGDMGTIFDNGNLEELYSVLEKLIINPELRASLGIKAQKRAQTFSKEIAGVPLINSARELITESPK